MQIETFLRHANSYKMHATKIIDRTKASRIKQGFQSDNQKESLISNNKKLNRTYQTIPF